MRDRDNPMQHLITLQGLKRAYDAIKAMVSPDAIMNAAQEVILENAQLLKGPRGPEGPKGEDGVLVYYNELSEEEKASINLDEVASSQVQIAEANQKINELQKTVILNTAMKDNTVTISDCIETRASKFNIYGRSWLEGEPSKDNPADIIDLTDVGIYVNGEMVGLKSQTQTPLVLRGIPDGNGGWISDWIDMKTGIIHRKVGVLRITDASDYTANATSVDGKYRMQSPKITNNVTYIQGGNVTVPGLCNVTKSIPAGAKGTNGAKEGISITTNWIYIYLEEFSQGSRGSSDPNDPRTDLERFKEYVSQNEIILTYPFATEETSENISDYGLTTYNLQMTVPTTKITSDNNVGIEVEYIVDTKNYIDNKEPPKIDPTEWQLTDAQKIALRKNAAIEVITEEEYDLLTMKNEDTIYIITG